MNVFSDRVLSVQRLLREQGHVGAIFAPTDQMRYISGWAESGHERFLALFVPAEGEPSFVTPKMNAPQAAGNPASIHEVLGWTDEAGWHASARRILRRWKPGRGAILVDDELASVHLLDLQQLVPRARFSAASTLMQQLREVKSADELGKLERSAAITDCVYEESVTQLREGMTELDFQDIIAACYRAKGTRPAFALICFGANSALPHHGTGNSRLRLGDTVIIDIGCVVDNYFSDITRTVSFGKPKPKVVEVYRVVHAAYQAALDFGRPGVAGEEVDTAARNVITKAGYGKYFIHRTGHGIGISGHEPPNIVQGNKQLLQPGMCFSDEPGIYLPGKFGVRIENVVTVSESGLRSLNAAPPESIRVIHPT